MPKDRQLKLRYLITYDEFEELLEQQHNCCKICEKEFETEKDKHVEHSHISGEVRGICCLSCNVALGHIRENGKTAISMLKYLCQDGLRFDNEQVKELEELIKQFREKVEVKDPPRLYGDIDGFTNEGACIKCGKVYTFNGSRIPGALLTLSQHMINHISAKHPVPSLPTGDNKVAGEVVVIETATAK